MQDDGYPDKVLGTVNDIPVNERPINQHWSWDRILRSCYIKQSDVLLGLFLYYEHFDRETIRRNFRFYEPRTVHESSLSPFVHAILAAWIGDTEEAYRLFLHSTRLDLDATTTRCTKACTSPVWPEVGKSLYADSPE